MHRILIINNTAPPLQILGNSTSISQCITYFFIMNLAESLQMIEEPDVVFFHTRSSRSPDLQIRVTEFI
ncbi:MAG: hypothetical protein A3G96_01770 [Gammaproteobacteria bacterium RIFCSPLOWO2_12_FULL_52_10]|nr:MAG: hypothetical protein A3G96_01770 [Gammaproteobacteria bacterium RIFCSPLOWO2_12_FULL_52_10]